jgi:hypothetical protein
VPLPQLYAIQAAAGRQTETISACLASIDRPETLPTGDRYALTLRRFRDQSSACTAVAAIDGTAVRGWIDEAWGGGCAPWGGGAGSRPPHHRAIDVFRSAWAYWRPQD